MQDIFDTSDLKITTYLLARENEFISYKESSDKESSDKKIFQFKKTQQLNQHISDYYSRKKIPIDCKRLLDLNSDLKFGLHHPEVLENLLLSFNSRLEKEI